MSDGEPSAGGSLPEAEGCRGGMGTGGAAGEGRRLRAVTEARLRQAEKAQASRNRFGSCPDASRCDRISENVWMNLRPLMTTCTLRVL